MKGISNAEIEKIIEKRPHLKDTLRLYRKVAEFGNIERSLRGGTTLTGVAYPSDLIDPIFESFSAVFDVPLENLEPLKEAMKFGHVDFTRLPLNELPSFSLPYHEDELMTILFLISRPYFLCLKDSFKGDDNFGEDGKCPVCNAKPSIASIDEENRRKLFCSFCGTSGYFKRIGCPVCLNADTSKLNIITIEDEKGFRIDTCDACGSYIKTIEAGLMNELSPDIADLISLSLDIIAQGKGYRRNSPNPLGMKRMA
ncbi:MAG: formate dehydrogenase accessory protein FdhE [Thermodesulfovibrionales bacterium]|jgi:FdhE protein|nr:formate dehydrogenase accessory protein FdhE [Thermodesulfovibrionales bacterium]